MKWVIYITDGIKGAFAATRDGRATRLTKAPSRAERFEKKEAKGLLRALSTLRYKGEPVYGIMLSEDGKETE